jgi:hypothetical protein
MCGYISRLKKHVIQHYFVAILESKKKKNVIQAKRQFKFIFHAE